MILGLTLHLLIFVVVGFMLDAVFSRWVRRPDVPAKTAMLLGFFLVFGRIIWLFWPLASPLPPMIGVNLAVGKVLEILHFSAAQSTLSTPNWVHFRLIEYWWGWILVVTLGLLAIWGLVRAWWASKQLRALVEENPLEGVDLDSTMYFATHGTRQNLEREYRVFTKAPRLAVRLSWLTDLPVLTGAVSPTLVVPMGLLERSRDQHLESILDHEAEHLRLNHHWLYAPLAWSARLLPLLTPLVSSIGRAMVVRVDRSVLDRSDGPDWLKYESAIRSAVADQMEWSPALAIPHSADEPERRILQASSKVSLRSHWQAGLLGGIFLLGAGGSTSVGRISTYTIKEFLMHRTIAGYQARLFDPHVRVVGIPDQGGIVPDGVVIDTTDASNDYEISSLEVLARSAVRPHAHAAEVSFDYVCERNGGDSTAPPSVSSRVMEHQFSEKENKHRFFVFDFRMKPIPEGIGHMTIPLRLQQTGPRQIAGSEDLMFGPDLAVPAGWRVTVTNWRIHEVPLDSVAASVFPDDAKGFVDWYQRFQRNTPLQLTW